MEENKVVEIEVLDTEPKVSLTEAQRRAIEAKGLVMVSASAGSGKTHTMLERIMHLIEEGVGLDKMLILVYNEANASELREKIRSKLFEKASECVGERAEAYRKQLDEIAFSTICTIHAFCRSALKKNFEAIGINPDFDILDETAHKVYMSKALDKTFEEFASKGDKVFFEVSSIFESKRKEENIRDNIVKLYERMDVQSDLDKFIASIKEYYTSRDSFDQIVFGRAIDKMRKVVAVANEILPVLNENNQIKSVEKLSEATVEMLPHFESKDENAIKNIIEKIGEIKSKSLSYSTAFRADNSAVVARAKKCYSTAKDLMEEIATLYADQSYVNKVFEQNKLYAEKLLEITLRFKEVLEAMKADDNVMGFSDLEHGAVKLIDSGVEIGADYDYVFVDEYQDVNGAQEYIIAHLVKNEAFMVGDVKQSIYGFRLSDPEIFLARQKMYAENAEEGKIEAPIFFKDNFRSDNAVLKFVNDIFDYAMTVESAGVDYIAEGRFNPVTQEERCEGIVEVHVFEGEDKDKNEAEGLYKLINHQNAERVKSAEEQEGEFIADKILELKRTSRLTIKKDKRPLQWGDFALLFRGRNQVSNKIIEVLKRRGIPVDEGSFAKENDPAETEFINMLAVIDNPRQDYALAGYMLSYLGGYTEQEMSEIVQCAEKGELYDKVKAYSILDNSLAEKIRNMFKVLDHYRILGSYMGVKGLVEKIIADTGYDAYLYSKSDAVGNSFNAYLKSINEDSITLSKYLREYKEGGREVKGRPEGGDRVHVSTMHSYKGLETPVVFLPGSDFVPKKTTKDRYVKKKNGASLPDLSVDASGCIGMSYFDVEGRRKDSNTISNKALQILAIEKEYKEEMRLLYVALTRAQKNMYISGVYSVKENQKRKPFTIDNIEEEFAVESFETEMNLFNYVFTAKRRGTLADCNIILHPGKQEVGSVEKTKRFYEMGGAKTAYDEELAKAIEKAQAFKYPHQEETTLALKYTVTQINADGVKDLAADMPKHEGDDEYNHAGVSVASIGTIYHKIMEHIDFAIDNLADTTNAIDKMVADGVLSREDRALVKDKEVLSALMNPIIKQSAGEKCYHEQPFMMYVPAKEVIDGSNSEDKVLVQGVIDLLVEGKNKYIVDFKYASLRTEEGRERYKKQLNLYKMAYKVAFGEEIDKIVLLSLKTGESFEL